MRFTKVHGLGNDFVLIDGRAAGAVDYCALAQRLCHRQTGIGADGLLIVLDSEAADIRMRIINSDGSEAEMCGNGIRCFAKWVYERGALKKDRFSVETLGGVMRPILTIENEKITSVTIDMGEPLLECKDIPVTGEGRCVGRPFQCGFLETHITSVRVGVPHTILYVEDPAMKKWMMLGPSVERANMFPKRTNVDFVEVLDRTHLVMRTFERGCGPTLACGTGACSACVAGVLDGYTDRSVDVLLELGKLHIEWSERDNHVYMTGPATLVYDGEIEL